MSPSLRWWGDIYDFLWECNLPSKTLNDGALSFIEFSIKKLKKLTFPNKAAIYRKLCFLRARQKCGLNLKFYPFLINTKQHFSCII